MSFTNCHLIRNDEHAIDREIDSSENRRAAVDRNDLPGGRCGFVRGEIQRQVGDV